MFRVFGFLLVVLATVTVVGCATTGTADPVDIINKLQLTEQEQAAVTVDYKSVTVSEFPDAIVLVSTSRSKSERYERYMAETTDGDFMPPIVVRGNSTTDTVSHRVMINTEYAEMCIPGTQECTRSEKRALIVIRDKPIKINNTFYPEQQIGNVGMMKITRMAVNKIIVAARTIKTHAPTPGACDKLSLDDFVTFHDDEPIREKIATQLSVNGYLPYQQVKGWSETLVLYRFARNGCLEDDPAKDGIVERGKKIVQLIE